ncbi:MAG: bifunctional DNA-formamidopyrimidine glycosylase/DNA-(apurinic or apyrimidinic site) lyase, partial [bacterium]|nr:bifunctional DNA-formamidopyrimidine glycosylase/DNA-(apurinic or apyrimidinic site) lyase [bacterium]
HTIKEVWVGWTKTIATPSAALFKKKLIGRRLKKVYRRGKVIIIDLDKGLSLVSHFRMTGHFRVAPVSQSASAARWYLYPPDRFTRVAFMLDHDLVLHFSDIRKFARLWLVATDRIRHMPALAKLGPEPLEPKFTPDKFVQCVRGYSGMIKPVLLNQACVAGIGNIYADESLFDAGVHPKTRLDKLDDAQLKVLGQMVKKNLTAAVKHGGSSVGDFVNTKGESGKHGMYLRVYGKKGEPCRRHRNGKPCAGTVKRIVVAQRGTHICPICQKVKR